MLLDVLLLYWPGRCDTRKKRHERVFLECVDSLKLVVQARLAFILCREVRARQVLSVQGSVIMLFMVGGFVSASGCAARGVHLPRGRLCYPGCALDHLAGSRVLEVILKCTEL